MINHINHNHSQQTINNNGDIARMIESEDGGSKELVFYNKK